MSRRCHICGEEYPCNAAQYVQHMSAEHVARAANAAGDPGSLPPFPTNPAERTALGIVDAAPQQREPSSLIVPGLRTAAVIIAALVLVVLFAGDPDLHDALIARLTAEGCP